MFFIFIFVLCILITSNFFSQTNAPFYSTNKTKLEQSRYRPGVVQKGSRKLRFSDFMTTAQDGGKVVSLRHRPPLPPGNTTGTHFC
jgi:hypothetical protein